jgi:ComF family protein
MHAWLIQIGSCINHYFKSFLHLLYPHICLQCGTDELNEQQIICDACEQTLPFTEFGKLTISPVEKIFWGRVPVQHVVAVLFFTKESLVQKIMAELKYHQNKRAGWLLGKLIAQELKQQDYFESIDFLVPIPISNRKKKKRGYNQTELICNEIIKHGMNCTLYKGFITARNQSTQTHKDRLQRNAQMQGRFILQQPDLLKDKNILIVDDVLTTGATLEAACQCILKASPASIRIATAAYTID